jgi:hypothetical protein
MGFAAAAVVVNKLLPPLFTSNDAKALSLLELEGAGAQAIAAGRSRASWQRVQNEQLDRLRRHVPLRQVLLPHMLVSAVGPETVEALSLALEALLAPQPTAELVPATQGGA